MQAEFNTVDIPGGQGFLGTNTPHIPSDEEGPLRENEITPFRMMRTAVTNRMFCEFVEATQYKTEAEHFGWSFVFNTENTLNAQSVSADTPWWKQTQGAYWQKPDGVQLLDDSLEHHPVVHVSWNDANAYARWAGGRLPLEREWEHAARGGQGDIPFPWGSAEPAEISFTPCNIWQGSFPQHNSAADGYKMTAPAESYEPNAFGLFNMCGNVWEWTAQSYKVRAHSSQARAFKKRMRGTKVLKGGSFLCHRSYCYRYRIAARTGNTPDSTTSHQGFRLVFDM